MAICPMRVCFTVPSVLDVALRCGHSRDLDIPPGTKPPNPEESERERKHLVVLFHLELF